MEQNKHGRIVIRLAIYLIGLCMLALGSTFTLKTGLGVACITASAASMSIATGWNLSVFIFLIYSAMITVQIFVLGKGKWWRVLLQMPVNVAFSLFLEWFGKLLDFQCEHLWQNLILMAVAPFISGTGLCLMVNMKMPPNPPDGLVYTISEVYGKNMGMVKNILDCTFVIIAVTVDLLSSGRLITVGIGTAFSMIFNGRAVALMNPILRPRLEKMAGLTEKA